MAGPRAGHPRRAVGRCRAPSTKSPVIASAAKQSIVRRVGPMDCFVAARLAMTVERATTARAPTVLGSGHAQADPPRCRRPRGRLRRPLVEESTGSPCDALEKRFVAVNTHGQAPRDPDFDALRRGFLGSLQGFSSGRLRDRVCAAAASEPRGRPRLHARILALVPARRRRHQAACVMTATAAAESRL